MSREYSNNIGIGFPITEDMIPDKYKKTKPEVSHFEDRFDPKTGKKLPQEKIIDEEEKEVFVLGKAEFETFEEFVTGLAKHLRPFNLGCISYEYGMYETGDLCYTMELESVRADGKPSGPDGLEVRDLIKLLPKYYKLRNVLHKMGIKVQNEPIIQLQETVG